MLRIGRGLLADGLGERARRSTDDVFVGIFATVLVGPASRLGGAIAAAALEPWHDTANGTDVRWRQGQSAVAPRLVAVAKR
jgi:hypothetical protein